MNKKGVAKTKGKAKEEVEESVEDESKELAVLEIAKKKEFDIMLREDIKTEEDVLAYAKLSYARMQLSWWEFAKSLYMIRESKAYECKYSSFHQYCEAEFASISHTIIVKFVAIVDRWYPVIEARFKKDETYSLPSYEACYTMITAEKREMVDKEEISKLKKAVLDGRISYYNLREKLKELIESKRRIARADVESLEKELEKDIKKDKLEDLDDLSGEISEGMEEEALFDSPDDIEAEEEEEEETDEITDVEIEEDSKADGFSVSKKLKILFERVKAVNDDLKGMTAVLVKKDINKEVIALGHEVEKTIDIADDFLTKLEEVTR